MKKLFLLIIFVCAVNAQAQIPSTLGWYEIPNTKIRSVCQGGATNSQCQNVVAAWSGGVFDSMRNRLIVWGGGHNDYYGNEIYAINLNGTPNSERITEACYSGAAFDEVCAGSNPPQPQSRHTYSFLSYIPTLDKMFSWTYAWSGASAWLFQFGDKTWHSVPITGAGVAINYITLTAYDPVSNRIYLFDGVKVTRFNPTDDTFSDIGGAYNFTDGMSAAVDPVKRIVLYVGAGKVYAYDLMGTNGLQVWTTTGATGGAACGVPGMDYEPTLAKVVVWCGGDTAYGLDTTTKVWTAYSYTGGPGAQQANGTYGRFRYAPAAGAFVLVNSIDQNAFILRLANGSAPPPVDTAAPSVPTSLTALPVSTSQINLTWAASTDNVGVTGYRLERCQNAGCSNFAEIAQPVAASYSNSGLTESTGYSYRVRAIDTAGNLSGYSAVVSATTPATPPIQPPISSTITVGPGKMYATICAAIAAAQGSNVIEVDAAVYQDESCNVTKTLTLKGIGGYAHMRWGTGDYSTNTANIPNGKATLIIQATTTIDRFEFSGAKVADENGAGIRYESGDLTITNSYLHGNQNGLLGQAGLSNTLLIENSRFDRNGFCGGGGCGHNLYVGLMGKLIFHANSSTNSLNGSHTLKSRAQVNEITDSFLSTRDSDGSLEADFPNGGMVYFSGNTVEQGANTSNSTMLGYGLEGATNPNRKLILSLNKFINRRTNGATFIQVNGSPAVDYKTNTFIGPGTVPANLNNTNTVAP